MQQQTVDRSPQYYLSKTGKEVINKINRILGRATITYLSEWDYCKEVGTPYSGRFLYSCRWYKIHMGPANTPAAMKTI